MKFKVLLSLLGLIFQSQLLAAEAIAPPQYVNTRGLDGFNYWFMKRLVVDVDELLKKQGLDSAVCTYRPNDGSEDLSYRELGKCLMKNFMAGMKTDVQPGVVYTWIRDSKGQFHPVEINWKPPQGGWGGLIRQIFEMKFEGALYWVRELIWDQQKAEKVNYNEFIVGELKIILPDNSAALETLSLKGSQWAQQHIRNLQSVSIKLNTQAKPKGQMVYSGPMVVQMKTANLETKTFNVQLTTNVNVMVMKRPFYVNSQIRTEGADLLEVGVKP